MFVRYFLDLAMPFDQAERALLAGPESWLPGVAREADDHGERLLAEVGAGEGVRVQEWVQVFLREPIRTRGRTLLPFSWEAPPASALFPSLEADLELAAMGPARSQLSVSARYTPPQNAVGMSVDRTLLHRVAEATTRDFVERAAASLERAAASELPGRGGGGAIHGVSSSEG
jgi:hypothetical protein